MEHLIRPLAFALVFGTICALLTLRGWLHMRKQWQRPVTLRDYWSFSDAVSRGDREAVRAIAAKYGAIMAVLFCAILAPVVAMASDQAYTLRSGSVQIGSAPGRVDMIRPTVRTMTLGTRVQFAFTVVAPAGSNPCDGGQQCHATVGLRSYNNTGIPFTEVWSTFTLPADLSDRALALDLPSTANKTVLPAGRCDLFVSIVRGQSVLFEHRVPVIVE